MSPVLTVIGRVDKAKRTFSPLYLAILSGILLIILMVNGFLEVNRAEKGFYLLLEREGGVLLQHFERNVLEASNALQLLDQSGGNPSSLTGFLYGLEDSVAEYLIEAAYQTDLLVEEQKQNPTAPLALVDHYSVSAIALYDAKGNLLQVWPSESPPVREKTTVRSLLARKQTVAIDLFGRPLSGKDNGFSVAIWRRKVPGVVALYLDGEQLKKLLQRFALRRAISDISLREGILYVSVQGQDLRPLAQSNPAPAVGGTEEEKFLRNALQTTVVLSRVYRTKNSEGVFEVVKSVPLDPEGRGLLRIGFSSEEIHPVLSQIKKNVFLSILFFLILGVSAIALIWVNQNRHLQRLREMEDRVQLAERLSSLGHLAAGVAHEIRNPLNAIGLALQRLKREFLPEDVSKREEYVAFSELIFKEVRRVNEIIEQFLTLSRPTQLNLSKASLQDLLNHLATLFQEEASARGITLRASIPSNLPLVEMDTPKLTQAFINIMKNGLEAMDQGGILRLEAHAFREGVTVVIADTGSGIPPDQLEKVFNYYYTTKEKGVGLGLPLAHRMIEAHGGQLRLESQVGAGTSVTVTLPLQKASSRSGTRA